MTQSYCTVAPHGSVSKPYTHGEHPPPDVHPTKNGINRYWSIATFYTFQKVPRNKSRRPSSGTRETTSFSTGQLLSRRRTTCPLRKSKKQESNPWEPTIWKGKHQKLTEKRFFWHGPRSIFSIQLQVINFRRVYYRLSSSVNNYSKYYRFLKSVLSFSKPQLNFQKIKVSRILLSITVNLPHMLSSGCTVSFIFHPHCWVGRQPQSHCNRRPPCWCLCCGDIARLRSKPQGHREVKSSSWGWVYTYHCVFQPTIDW